MSLKILVVDDASFTRDLIRRTLRKQFPAVEIEDAVNGRKAQQLMNKTQFDMVLCDWEMPEMTGVELLKWCREQPKYQKDDVPFVMITSRGDKDHVVEAVQAGVTDYLGKPFSGEQLVNKVLGAAKKHKLAGKLAIPTLVRFENKQFRCMVIQFSKQEASMLIKSDDVVPQVLGQAVLDLEHKSTINRLNYYVQSVATTEKKHDSTFLTVGLRLIDQDAEKETFIKSLFDAL